MPAVIVASARAVKDQVQKKLREVIKPGSGREGYWPAVLKTNWWSLFSTVIIRASAGTGNAVTKRVTLGYSLAITAPSERSLKYDLFNTHLPFPL